MLFALLFSLKMVISVVYVVFVRNSGDSDLVIVEESPVKPATGQLLLFIIKLHVKRNVELKSLFY